MIQALKRWFPPLVAGALLLAAACDGGDKPAAAGAAAAASTPRRGGTLVAGATADITSLNPYLGGGTINTAEVADLLFLRLLVERPDAEDHPPTLEPRLAERWEVSDDQRTVTFHLRPGVTWSDGQPVTAEDVRFTWQAQVDSQVAWDAAYYKDGITDVEVVDPLTVRFHLERPVANLLLRLNEGVILPKHAWGALPFAEWRTKGDFFREHMVVAGPYKLAAWVPQQELVLERNERYFDPERPYIDRLVLRIVADQASLLTQALAGDLDFVAGVTINDVPKVEASPRLKLDSYWTRAYTFVAWNLKNPLFASADVRRALTLALDRQSIAEVTYRRFGRVACSPIVSNFWAHDRTLQPLPYDPQQAKQILAAAGWGDVNGDGILDKDGRPFAFELSTNVGNPQRADAAAMIQEQLKRVGIAASPRFINFNVLVERSKKGEYDAMIMRWSMPTDLDLSYALHTRSIGEDNVFAYSNPEMDRLLEAAVEETTTEGLGRTVAAIQQIVHRDQPATFLYESQDLLAVTRRLHGEMPNMLRRFWHLWEWWLEPAA